MKPLLLLSVLAAMAVPTLASAAVKPQLDSARLDVYFLEGEANSLGFYAYPYAKVSKLVARVKGVTGKFAFKDVSPNDGAPYKTYSGCRNTEQLTKAQRKAFVELAGKQAKITFTWRFKGDKYKTTIKTTVAGAEGNGPSCDQLED
jgi:hypothetical protein